MNEIKGAFDELSAAFQAAGQAVYAASNAQQNAAPGAAPSDAPASEAKKDDVVEADYEIVDDWHVLPSA